MIADDTTGKTKLIELLSARPTESRQSDAISVALNAAHRVFPLWSGAMGQGWANSFDKTALPVLRCNLISGVVRRFPSAGIDIASQTMITSSVENLASFAEHADSVRTERAGAMEAATAAKAASFTSSTALSPYNSINNAANAVKAAHLQFDAWSYAFDSDLALIEAGKDLASLPLWNSSPPPSRFTAADTRAREIWAQDPETWDFWIRWWDGILTGNQLDWDLQKAVALEIPEAAWSDPKTVAAHIRRIEEREALHREVAELRAQLAASQEALVADPAHRGHNNPPELLDLPAEVREARSEIAAQLEIVSVELAKPRQSSVLLRKAGVALVAGAKTILLYCGRKADAVLDQALKPVGLALGTQAAALLSGVTWEQVMAFGNSLVEFAAKWPWP